MVEELQLSDQDVTTIAEMIDAQILALVPDWKPGASFEDVTPETGYSDQDCLQDLTCKRSEREISLDHTSVDESCMVKSLITQDIYSSALSPSTDDESPARGEGMMHGRFEEVTYNRGGSDYSPSSTGGPPLLSSISFDHQAYEDSLYNVADRTLLEVDPVGRNIGVTGQGAMSSLLGSTPTDACGAAPGEIGCMAFNDLVECQRNAGCSSKYTHQTWEMIMNIGSSMQGQDACAKAEMPVLDKSFHSPLPWALGGSAAVTPTDLTDGEEELDQELKLLVFEQEQELIELRRKHENAISEARSRWERKSGTIVSSRSVQDGGSDTMICTTVVNPHLASSGSLDNFPAHGSLSPLVDWEARLATGKETSTIRKSVDSDRLSLQELSALSSQTSKDYADRPSTIQTSWSNVVVVKKVESAVQEPTAASKDIFNDEKGVLNHGGEQVNNCEKAGPQDKAMKCVAESSPPFEKSMSDEAVGVEAQSPETEVQHKLVLEVHSLIESTLLERLIVEPKPSKMLEKTDHSIQERLDCCISTSRAGSSSRKDKCSDKAAYESQVLLSITSSCQSGEASLESKKEQLQRSIAKLEAKTLEGLQSGLVPDLVAKKSLCGPSVQPTDGMSAASQARPNLARESGKH